MNKLINELHCRSDVETAVLSEYCTVYSINNETGSGKVTVYEVLPGIVFAFEKYDMDGVIPVITDGENLMTIKYCKSGRLENFLENRFYCYIKEGDFRISSITNTGNTISFPTHNYEGITVLLDAESSEKSLAEQFKGFEVNIKALCEKFSDNLLPFVISDETEVNHIFGDIYNAPDNIKIQYFRLKLIELLYYFNGLDIENIQVGRPYFYERLVNKIKSARELMVSDLTRNYTIEELSEQFEIGLTQLKMCFKTVYGSPISTYIRIYRLNYAAYLLKTDRNLKISDIAGRAGYDSPSKFTSAFKKELGETPFEYRKNHLEDSTESEENSIK